jgi:plasmid segregation protein ParM
MKKALILLVVLVLLAGLLFGLYHFLWTADNFAALGEKAMKSGNYARAVDRYTTAVSLAPDNVDYVLALAAIARELNIRKMTCGKIRIAAGLPLTWVSGQRDEFRDYLLQNRTVEFSFRNISYHVEIVGVDVFPQGFAAVADRLSDFRGVNMICDIGNGTMNIMFINDKKPVSGNMFTEKYGTHQCLLAVRENVMRAHHTTVDEAIINRVFRFGTADIKEDYLKTITDTATDYVEGIFQRLREHEYNPELMRLYVLGGGSCLIRNFGVYDASRVTINDDICATAKGYEYLAYVNLLKNGGTV